VAVEVRDRTVERSDHVLDQLERLWALPAVDRRPRRKLASETYGLCVRALVFGWPAVILGIALLAPSPAPGATYSSWMVAAGIALTLGPIVAGYVGAGFPMLGLGMSASLGGVGIAAGIACRATAHHMGAWWMVETALFACLAVVSVAALALRARA